MRSTELRLEQYDSDKIAHRYLQQYDAIFEPLVREPVRLLELGVYNGGSLLLWRDYFPRGEIVGIDLSLPKNFTPGDRISIFQGNQIDTAFLSRVAEEAAPEGFDIIIDDASHFGMHTKISFWHLFERHLKPGGIYAIEDWGTGYWNDWPDGESLDLGMYDVPETHSEKTGENGRKVPWPNHSYGMVALVKQLIDEQGAANATRGAMKGVTKRISKFDEMLITAPIVFVRKPKIGKNK